MLLSSLSFLSKLAGVLEHVLLSSSPASCGDFLWIETAHMVAHCVRAIIVTDSGPHHEIERKRERLLRPRHPSGPLQEKIQHAEAGAAQEILQEGLRYLPIAETLSREGRPEQEIIQSAFAMLLALYSFSVNLCIS